MGKTFRRDEDWNKEKENKLRKFRQTEKDARRAAMEADDEETDADFGETNDSFWEKSGRFGRR